MAIDAIIVEDMKTNEYFVQFSVYFQRVIPSEKVKIVSTLYFNTAFQKNTPGKLIIFIDESAAKTNMIRLYGRSIRGKRCFDKTPHNCPLKNSFLFQNTGANPLILLAVLKYSVDTISTFSLGVTR